MTLNTGSHTQLVRSNFTGLFDRPGVGRSKLLVIFTTGSINQNSISVSCTSAVGRPRSKGRFIRWNPGLIFTMKPLDYGFLGRHLTRGRLLGGVRMFILLGMNGRNKGLKVFPWFVRSGNLLFGRLCHLRGKSDSLIL